MDRSEIAGFETAQIADALAGAGLADQWNRLTEIADAQSALLLQNVCRVSPAERIAELRELETGQAERGASFLGMLPDQIPDDLPVPSDLETSLDVAIRLAEIRCANLEAIAGTMPQYELSFTGERLEIGPSGAAPEGWRLDIDVDGIRAALDFFDSDDPSLEQARTVAEMPAFEQMMRHRRELGYVPEPLIDVEGFTWCLVHAASSDPIDEIWKWLHPQNLFDLSDLFAYRLEYRALIDQLSEGGALANHILGAIAPYAPSDTVFADTFSFAVGWGILGWATEETGGMNIEHAKDNFPAMLPTLVHETYHRLQTVIARPNPKIDGRDFDRITSYPFDSVEDRRLYQALCYVMLEGSATFIASEGSQDVWREGAAPSIELLERVRALSPSSEEDACDEILTEGLRSNGPFYQFGALLSQAIVENGGPSSLGAALQTGAPFFLDQGIALLGSEAPALPEGLLDHVQELLKQLPS